MKSKFSTSWVSSRQPRKQVKFRANAPHHIRRRFMAAPLNKTLKQRYGVNTVEVRKGDEVKVLRGKFLKKQGKVGKVDVTHTRIQIDGVQRLKKGGEKLETWFHPSKVMIIELDTSDKKRFKRRRVIESKNPALKEEKKKREPEKTKPVVSKKPKPREEK
jgi:large subunit ribosomal protein L24